MRAKNFKDIIFKDNKFYVDLKIHAKPHGDFDFEVKSEFISLKESIQTKESI